MNHDIFQSNIKSNIPPFHYSLAQTELYGEKFYIFDSEISKQQQHFSIKLHQGGPSFQLRSIAELRDASLLSTILKDNTLIYFRAYGIDNNHG